MRIGSLDAVHHRRLPLRGLICAATLAGAGLAAAHAGQVAVQQQSPAPAQSPAVPADAEQVRAEIRSLEGILPTVADRGATLFLLARRYAHLGELAKALALLKECVALDAGFVPDPQNSPSLKPLQSNPEFLELLEHARRAYQPVHRANVAYVVAEKDLFPEGLAVDASRGLFYMGSMHRKKIVAFRLNGTVSDFVKQDAYDLSPVGGVHVDPTDHSVWASTDAGEKRRPELLHFDRRGHLLERFASPGKMPHDLNDLVLRGTREVFTTDTEGNHVYRFDRSSHAFHEMTFWRPVYYPNGITLSGDGNLLFVSDILGVLRVDLRTNESTDVDPGPDDTLCGIDGLYWYQGEFLGIQYGTGEYRVMRWKLAPNGRQVVASETLEYRTDLVKDPTTGAIYHGKFYLMANTGIANLQDDKIVDPAALEPVRIAALSLR